MLQKRYSLGRIGKSRAFSLVELLIVIAIIGILAVMVTVSYGGAQKRSRDTLRKADLQKIASALEMRYAETKTYPDSDSYIDTSGSAGTIIVALAGTPQYLAKIPCDPLIVSDSSACAAGSKSFGAETYGYAYYKPVSGNKYALFTNLESSSTNDPDNRISELSSMAGLMASKFDYAIGN
ncbi:MAG TPA: prepilin-type N-terminal cleavage/methylation domain-containing protein [bacterium]|nr:prepilin-type N-terminal cleavage/methylation domain-containing protein [bacterium]